MIYDCSIFNEIDAFHNLNKGSVFINNNNNLTSINGFENLVESNNLSIANNFFLNQIPFFERLEKINADLVVTGNYALEISNCFPNLIEINNDLILSGLSKISSFEKLETIGRDLNISKIDSIQNLNSFNSLLTANVININAQTVIEFNSFLNLRKCRTLSLNMNKLKLIKHFNQLDTVPYFLSISCKNLEEISGFNSLEYVGLELNLSPCPNLTKIHPFNNLTEIGGLTIRNTGLDSIIFLNNLRIINNNNYTNIDVSNNNKLTFIGNMPLVEAWRTITISGNPILTNIDGFKNINPYLVGSSNSQFDLVIKDNASLSICGIKSICGLLAIPDKNIDIQNNAVGCNEISEINCDIGYADGLVFYDFDGDGEIDSDELGVNNQKVLISPPNYSFITNTKGEFTIGSFDENYISVAPLLPQDWEITTDSASYTFNNTFNNDYEFIFGLQNTVPDHSMRVNLSSGSTRCNTTINAKIRYENTGTFKENAVVELLLDPLVELVSSTPSFSQIQGTSHKFLVSMVPFETGEIELRLKMPDETHTGEELDIKVGIYEESLNLDDAYDVFEYKPIVRCSYDPNDKLVIPSGVQEENYTLLDQKLTYTIRFQNTGNAEAIDITIRDILDENLDIESFRIMNSSFPVNTKIENREVTFEFKDIYLPDSISNEPGSHGFVTYELNHLPGIDENTQIENTAYIIFDFNPAIVTNTTLNTMVTTIPVISHTENTGKYFIKIYPNPTNSLVTISADSDIIDAFLFDTRGNLLKQTQENQLDLSFFNKGFYIIGVKVETGMQFFKVLKM